MECHVNGDGKVQPVRQTHGLRFFFPNDFDRPFPAGGFRFAHPCPFGQIDEPVRQCT